MLLQQKLSENLQLAVVLHSEFVKISWHLVDLSVVMLLDLFDENGVFGQNKVNCSSFSAETTGSTNSVDVVFLFKWKFIVDYETNLLNINTSSKQIGGDKYSYWARSELLHDNVSL